MTIYQLVPLDLQGTFFFKVVQLIMREIQDQMEVKRFKYVLFMFLHVESQSRFTHKFNDGMLQVHEDIGDGCMPLNQEPQPSFWKPESEEEIAEPIERLFLSTCLRVESEHDFE